MQGAHMLVVEQCSCACIQRLGTWLAALSPVPWCAICMHVVHSHALQCSSLQTLIMRAGDCRNHFQNCLRPCGGCSRRFFTPHDMPAGLRVCLCCVIDPRQDPTRRLMVGLVGYPNVGKSSTINAIFGSKKTAVAPTPGKTKHFQTLNVTPTVCLCDCPGRGAFA
jgi:hypothetical protein